jgi:hypothetical protein
MGSDKALKIITNFNIGKLKRAFFGGDPIKIQASMQELNTDLKKTMETVAKFVEVERKNDEELAQTRRSIELKESNLKFNKDSENPYNAEFKEIEERVALRKNATSVFPSETSLKDSQNINNNKKS